MVKLYACEGKSEVNEQNRAYLPTLDSFISGVSTPLSPHVSVAKRSKALDSRPSLGSGYAGSNPVTHTLPMRNKQKWRQFKENISKMFTHEVIGVEQT